MLEHPWFLDFNRAVLENFPDTHIAPNSPELWNLVRRLPAGHPLEPPFVPELKEGAEDHSNFDDFSDASAMELYKDVYEKQDRLQNQLLAASQNGQQVKTQRQAFVGFTFRHKKALNNGPSSSTATSGNPGPALPPKPTPDMMTKIREMARMSQ